MSVKSKSGTKPPRPARNPWRPTKYGPKILRQMKDYYDRHLLPENAHLLPTFMELAIEMEVSERTLENWAHRHKDFFRAYNRLKTLQKLRITTTAFGKDKPFFEMFMLKANHKMVEYKPIDDRDVGNEINLRIRVTDETTAGKKA